MRYVSLIVSLVAAPILTLLAAPALTQAPPSDMKSATGDADGFVALSDDELAAQTGKFLMPNGVEITMAVTSDTIVNGQAILRTVMTVDKSAQVQVFGRTGAAPTSPYQDSNTMPTAQPTGLSISLDRQSGIQTVTPTFSVGTPGVTVGGNSQSAEDLGLGALPVVPGGPAVQTPDGAVSLALGRNGAQVSLAGDQLAVTNLVGSSIATAVVNSANDRTIDTVTNVAIDLKNVQPYAMGAAGMRIDTLTQDAMRGMVR